MWGGVGEKVRVLQQVQRDVTMKGGGTIKPVFMTCQTDASTVTGWEAKGERGVGAGAQTRYIPGKKATFSGR